MRSLLHPRRRTRLRLTLLAVFALLFQQAALASYVCARADMPMGGSAMAAHCDGMPMAQAKHAPALCAWHCSGPAATTQNAHTLSVPSLDLPAPFAWVSVALDPAPVAQLAYAHAASQRSRSIPPALRFRVLLI